MQNDQDFGDKKSTDNTIGWEREVLEKLALAAVTEQRRARRWNVFFKSLMFLYLIAIGVIALYPRFEEARSDEKQHTAIVDIFGVIADGEVANADAIIEGLREAVKDEKTKGVILNINSPGGSPVQSGYIYEEIRRLKVKHPDMPIYAVVSDICASGGYYIASAADEIYVHKSSMIGSIGVLMNGFGFSGVMEKLGVDRRLLIAGKHKALLDPFSPVNEEENRYMQTLLDNVHQQFISAVKTGRGDRLLVNKETFSGLVWTGEQGVKLGLADAFGNVDSVARDIIGAKKKVNFTQKERLLDKIAAKLGASFGHAIGSLVTNPSLR